MSWADLYNALVQECSNNLLKSQTVDGGVRVWYGVRSRLGVFWDDHMTPEQRLMVHRHMDPHYEPIEPLERRKECRTHSRTYRGRCRRTR